MANGISSGSKSTPRLSTGAISSDETSGRLLRVSATLAPRDSAIVGTPQEHLDPLREENIFDKLSVEKRAQAIARAQSLGLLRTV